MFFERLRYQSLSLFIHILIVLAFVLFQKLDLISPKTSEETKIKIIGQAIRVDVVAMPKMTIQELKNIDTEAPGDTSFQEVKKVESTGGDESTVFKKNTKKQSFADMLKNLSKRKVSKSKKKKVIKKKKSGAGGFSGTSLKRIQALGNKLSKGTALYGKGSEAAAGELDSYTGHVISRVRVNWQLPSYLKDKGLSCKIRVFISNDGRIFKFNMYESSGNKDFDSWAIRAVREAGRLNPPSKSISSSLSTGSLILSFPFH